MNNLKRAFQLFASLASIIVALLCISLEVYRMVTRDGYSSFADAYEIVVIILSVALLIPSIWGVKNPSEKAYMNVCVAGLMLNGIICMVFAVFKSLVSLIPLIPMILYVVSLCLRNGNKTDATIVGQAKSNTNNQSDGLDRIEEIKKLNKQGILTDAEMKALIIEVLKNNK